MGLVLVGNYFSQGNRTTSGMCMQVLRIRTIEFVLSTRNQTVDLVFLVVGVVVACAAEQENVVVEQENVGQNHCVVQEQEQEHEQEQEQVQVHLHDRHRDVQGF